MRSRSRFIRRTLFWLILAGFCVLIYHSLPARRANRGGGADRMNRRMAAMPEERAAERTGTGLDGGKAPAGGAQPVLAVAEVGHSPAQPGTGAAVVVTARPEKGTAGDRLVLQFQVVEPGAYVRKTDREFEQGWRDIPMRDDGLAGDSVEGDGIFSAQVGGEYQKHRRLVRYRLRGVDREGVPGCWPAPSHACPNRAWLVYDGIPAWTGASRPGRTEEWRFPAEFFATLPAYHLVARREDVERSQWQHDFNRQLFHGTLVYDGRVYDHVQFHNRGQGSTYVAGKNKWGFKFPAGQEFRARDRWGRAYRLPWKGFNLNACASPWAPVNRGMAGLDEAVSYRAYQLAGVPSPDTHWVDFRVIDAGEEASPRDQYQGDPWGLYLVVEEKNGTWLEERGLPDGSIYSAESGQKHQVAGKAPGPTELSSFLGGTSRQAGVDWWRANLDLERYYTFHALNRVLANIDLRQDGNHYLYHPPDGRWVVLPHDLDMMFIPKTHWPGVMAANACLRVPALRTEYRNRAREILDLFCADPSPQGGQVGQLVAEMAGFIAPAGQSRTWAEFDEALWNWHPRSHHRGQFNKSPAADGRMGGNWVRRLASPDFAGYCRYIVDFCTDSRPEKHYRPNDGDQRGYGFGFLSTEARDDQAPPRPTIQPRPAGGSPTRAPGFEVVVAPEAAKTGKLEWRLAEISAPGLAGYTPGEPYRYELETIWSTNRVEPSAVSSIEVPAEVCRPGRTYRIRARYGDSQGRWGHWSAPVQFVAAKAER